MTKTKPVILGGDTICSEPFPKRVMMGRVENQAVAGYCRVAFFEHGKVPAFESYNNQLS
jgi:hypothetical protein